MCNNCIHLQFTSQQFAVTCEITTTQQTAILIDKQSLKAFPLHITKSPTSNYFLHVAAHKCFVMTPALFVYSPFKGNKSPVTHRYAFWK